MELAVNHNMVFLETSAANGEGVKELQFLFYFMREKEIKKWWVGESKVSRRNVWGNKAGKRTINTPKTRGKRKGPKTKKGKKANGGGSMELMTVRRSSSEESFSSEECYSSSENVFVEYKKRRNCCAFVKITSCVSCELVFFQQLTANIIAGSV